MKNTFITLASVAALAGAANAQVTIGGTTYSAGTTLRFNNLSDALAGSVSSTFGGLSAGDAWNRSYGVTGVDNTYFNEDTYLLGTAGASPATSTLSWGTAGNGEVADFFRTSSGELRFVLAKSVTIGGTTYNPGNPSGTLVFSSFADAIAGNVSSAIGGYSTGTEWNRSYGITGVDDTFFNEDTYQLGSIGAGATSGILAWGTAGNNEIDDFYRDSAGTIHMVIANVPEPSSTALLGLGGLALILRRKK